MNTERPVRPGRGCPFLQSSHGGGGLLTSTGSDARFDQLDEGESDDAQVVVFTGPSRTFQGGLVAAETVVQQRDRVAVSADRSSLASRDRFREAAVHMLQRRQLAAPCCEQERGVPRRGVAGRLGDRISLLGQ